MCCVVLFVYCVWFGLFHFVCLRVFFVLVSYRVCALRVVVGVVLWVCSVLFVCIVLCIGYGLVVLLMRLFVCIVCVRFWMFV